ncbi:MAG: hypothetical protein JXQ87_02995 [Bacteroidia bacterium]
MKRLTLICIFNFIGLIVFGQELTIGIPHDSFWNLDNFRRDDFEYHPNSYRDSVVFNLEDIKYLDTSDFTIYLTDSGMDKFDSFRTGIYPRPIVFGIDGRSIFGSWTVLPISSHSCNWITCIVDRHEKSIEISLGYPNMLFKYYNDEFVDPRKNVDFLGYFIQNDKIK